MTWFLLFLFWESSVLKARNIQNFLNKKRVENLWLLWKSETMYLPPNE